MAFMDETVLGELWARIGQVFARLTQAIGRITVSNAVLYAYRADGTLDASYSLDDDLATDAEAAAADSLTMSGTSLKLSNCDGAQKSSVDLATNLDPRYAADVSVSGTTLTLKSKSGANLRAVTLPTTDTAPIYDYMKRHYAASLAVSLSADRKLTVALYNGEGTKINEDYVYIPAT